MKRDVAECQQRKSTSTNVVESSITSHGVGYIESGPSNSHGPHWHNLSGKCNENSLTGKSLIKFVECRPPILPSSSTSRWLWRGTTYTVSSTRASLDTISENLLTEHLYMKICLVVCCLDCIWAAVMTVGAWKDRRSFVSFLVTKMLRHVLQRIH